MKRLLLLCCLTFGAIHIQAASAFSADTEFDRFLLMFDYETRDEMKIDSKGLLSLLARDKAILLDIRFKEEVAVWHMEFGLKIPLNELPKRLGEIPKNKIIVAACPHKDRSAVAMAYLRSKGYDAKYLTDGLIGLAEQLRGENAKDFLEELEAIKFHTAKGDTSMKVEVLGTGCAKCKTLHENVKRAVQESGKDVEVVKVEDIPSIMKYGVMSTPALVVDGQVKVSGKVPSIIEIMAML